MRSWIADKPGFPTEAGLLRVRGEAQHCRQIAAQHDRQPVAVRLERDLIDQATEDGGGFSLGFLGLQAFVQSRDPLPVHFGHVRMQKGRGLGRARQYIGEFRFARFEPSDFVLELDAGYAIENSLDRAIQLALNAFQLFAVTDDL